MEAKEIRKGLNMTQEEFAREIGVSVRTVGKWEAGKFNPSRLAQEKLHKLERRVKQ